MAQPAVKVEGARELRRTLRTLSKDLTTDGFKDANGQVSQLVATAARSGAPTRTGRLAASLRGNAAATNATVRAGGARAPYANAIHWGTGPRRGLRGPHNIRRRPFIWQAADRNQQRIEETYFDALESMVRKVHGA